MSTADYGTIAAMALAGVILGLFYFGGLWWTVSRLSRSSHSLPLYFASLIVRLAVVLAAFYAAIHVFDWLHLVACLVGFMLTRLVVVRYTSRFADREVIHRENV